MVDFKNISKIHFIGVGGVSLSKLASYFARRGYSISGSDAADSPLLEQLRSKGVDAYVGIDVSKAISADIVVYSSAIHADNAELAASIANGVKTVERKRFMRDYTALFDTVAAISGAHGKTTAASILASIMLYAKEQFTAHIGGDMQGLDNLELDSGDKYLVVEACEYRKSFLEFNVDYGVILNVDYDHPDCYANIDEVYQAFAQFAHYAKRSVIIDSDYYADITQLHQAMYRRGLDNVLTYGDDFNADYCYLNISRVGATLTFDVFKQGEFYNSFVINSINAVNIKGATAAIAVADTLGIDKSLIASGVRMFAGVKRRAECLGLSASGVKVMTDYAHHPSEIERLLYNVRAVVSGDIHLVFEPHTYSRSKALSKEFAQALKQCDHCYLLPTYPARESKQCGIDSEELAKLFTNSALNVQLVDYTNVSHALSAAHRGDIILLVGAGIDYMRIYQGLV